MQPNNVTVKIKGIREGSVPKWAEFSAGWKFRRNSNTIANRWTNSIIFIKEQNFGIVRVYLVIFKKYLPYLPYLTLKLPCVKLISNVWLSSVWTSMSIRNTISKGTLSIDPCLKNAEKMHWNARDDFHVTSFEMSRWFPRCSRRAPTYLDRSKFLRGFFFVFFFRFANPFRPLPDTRARKKTGIERRYRCRNPRLVNERTLSVYFCFLRRVPFSVSFFKDEQRCRTRHASLLPKSAQTRCFDEIAG